MSSHTKADRRGDIRAYFNTYKLPVKLKSGELDQCADLGKYDVFMSIFPQFTNLFLDESVYANGAAYPANYFGFAGRAYIIDGTGTEQPVTWVHPTEVPFLTRNARLAPTTVQPLVFTSDHTFLVLPNTVSVHIDTFVFPAPLADAATADNTTDSMPEWTEPLIARAAFEYGVKMMLDQQTALALSKLELERAEKALKELYERKFIDLNTMPTEVA